MQNSSHYLLCSAASYAVRFFVQSVVQFSQWLSPQRNSRSWQSVKCILRWVMHFFSRICRILILTWSANTCRLHTSHADLFNLEWDSDCPKLSVPLPDTVSEQALVVTGATKQRLLELVSQALEWLLLSFPMRGFPALLSKGSVSVWWSGLWVLHLRQMWGCLRTEVSRMMKRPKTKVFQTLWISHAQAGKIKWEVIQPSCVVAQPPNGRGGWGFLPLFPLHFLPFIRGLFNLQIELILRGKKKVNQTKTTRKNCWFLSN